ncbi:uncharacterized protein LOC110197778 isoform X2 [Phascolarctos cinereus]|uniref:Zinc finger protein 34-like isoform X2 n=1 Tax=Phascolarctos cinereus TaxID=38626 RepID=A0A6P5IZI4_PHACI|nr:zinc finger protein 34-like isoform X2 [Phascolarctos cinereus]
MGPRERGRVEEPGRRLAGRGSLFLPRVEQSLGRALCLQVPGYPPVLGSFSLPSSACRGPRPDPAGSLEPEGMARGSCRPPAQEEWGLLDHPQKELYKEVVVENAHNLLSLGRPVPRKDLMSYFEEKEAPWLLEQEGLRSCCPEGEIRPEMKETTAKLRISVKETQEESFMRDGPCDFTGRQICAAFHRIHRGGNPHDCHHCGKVLRQQSSFIYHQKINPGVKPHECHECGKAFSEYSSFIMHQKIHIGRTPYECNQCGKVFTESYNLIQHQRLHTGEKPYECNQCGKGFTRNYNLIKHERLHSGERLYEFNGL